MQIAVPAEAVVEPAPGLMPGLKPAAGIADRVLGRIGSLEARLARDETEVASAQEIRYRVFYEELGAGSNRAQFLDRRELPTGSILSAITFSSSIGRFPAPSASASSVLTGF